MRKTGSRRSAVPSRSEKLKHSHHITLERGKNFYVATISFENTPLFHTKYNSDLTLGSVPSTEPLFQIIAHLYIPTPISITVSWTENFQLGAMLAHFLEPKWNQYWVLSRPLPFLSYQNQESPENFVQFTTSHIHTRHTQTYIQLITPLILIFTLVHGELSPPSASWSGISHRVHRHQSVTWLRHTVQFQSILNSGLDSLSSYEKMTNLPSTHATTLDLHQQEALTDIWVTQQLTSSERVVSGRFPNGSTTTYFLDFLKNTSLNITKDAEDGILTLLPTGDNFNMAADYGIEEKHCQMESRLSLTKMLAPHFVPFQPPHATISKVHSSHTTTRTLTTSQKSLAYLGKAPKPSHSTTPYLISASCGISKTAQFLYQKRRKKSTVMPSPNGRKKRLRHYKRLSSYTESFYTHHWLSPLEEHISHHWKPCWVSSMTVLSYLAPPQKALPVTFRGGSISFPTLISPTKSQAPSNSLTGQLIQMPAQESASQLSLEIIGGLGGSYPGGNQKGGTLDRRKPLVSSSSSKPSWFQAHPEINSKFSATTEESLRAGGKAEVRIKPPIMSSAGFTMPQLFTNASSTHGTFQARKTQQTTPLEASTLPSISSSQPSQSPTRSKALSSTMTNHDNQLKSMLLETELSHIPFPNQPRTSYREQLLKPKTRSASGMRHSSYLQQPKTVKHRAWDAPLPGPSQGQPTPYQAELTPLQSPFRPHCLARERILLWKPHIPRPEHDREFGVSREDLTRIGDVISHAWTENTRQTYGTGLLIYHVFCDKKQLPEPQRVPATPMLLSTFVSTLAGSYSGKAISNYLYGVRAWHILHGLAWRPNETEMETLLKAAANVAPETSKRKKRRPYTIDFITKLKENMNMEEPLDAAVFACLTTCFYAMGRVGEFTTPRLNAFNASIHITRKNLKWDRDRNGLPATELFIPRTKSAPLGETVQWSRQHGPTDPEEALSNHLRVNNPADNAHLFSYRHKKTIKPLTKTKFIERLAQAARAAGEDPLQGHGIRIGATLEYLLRNIPFEAVKVMGRWASRAFTLYLRKHGQILAPYLQAQPELHQEFLRNTIELPEVR